jgi:hypothetical protein
MQLGRSARMLGIEFAAVVLAIVFGAVFLGLAI